MPLQTLLGDQRLGRSVPITMALVGRLVRTLQDRNDLDAGVRIGLMAIEQAAADVLAMTAGEELAGSTSPAESRSRLERLAWFSGIDTEVVMEGPPEARHPPLLASDVSVRAGGHVVRQLGDALLHLRRQASRVSRTLTETLLQVQVVLYLEHAATIYSSAPESVRSRLLRDISVDLVTYLGREPDEAALLRVLAGYRNRGRRGVQLWEPMASLLSPLTPDLDPQTLRDCVKRWRPSLSGTGSTRR